MSTVTAYSTVKQPFNAPLKWIHFFMPTVWNSSTWRKWWWLHCAEKNDRKVREGHQTRPLQLSCWDLNIFLNQRIHKQIALFPFGLWEWGLHRLGSVSWLHFYTHTHKHTHGCQPIINQDLWGRYEASTCIFWKNPMGNSDRQTARTQTRPGTIALDWVGLNDATFDERSVWFEYF